MNCKNEAIFSYFLDQVFFFLLPKVAVYSKVSIKQPVCSRLLEFEEKKLVLVV